MPLYFAVDRDKGRILGRDAKLVVVPLVAVAGPYPCYLPVGAIEDHVLALAVTSMESLPPGEHRLSLVCLRPEVHHIHILVLQEVQPHGLSVVVEDHRTALLCVALLRSNEDIAGGDVIARLCGHLNRGWAKVGARAEGPHATLRRGR